jgi:catechol 2,3-dioxygenase-like lactoylglutathione lyase family enzyme
MLDQYGPGGATATVVSVSSHGTDESGCGGEVLPLGLRFELFVDDVEASVRFYGATLELLPPESWSPDGYVPLRAGAVTIGVQHYTKLPAEHHFNRVRLAGPRGVGVEIVIEVDDVDRAYAFASPEAERHRGRIEPLAERSWGAKDFRLIDPDGYYVRVTSRTA